MKYTQDEILKALNIIKEICSNADDCTKCPFREKQNTDLCYITAKIPINWEIRSLENKWRAFDD